jgi:hypothetical protein
MRQECSKFGAVERVTIYEDRSNGGAVKIFVLFYQAAGTFTKLIEQIISEKKNDHFFLYRC